MGMGWRVAREATVTDKEEFKTWREHLKDNYYRCGAVVDGQKMLINLQ
jgi:hypothetical protein